MKIKSLLLAMFVLVNPMSIYAEESEIEDNPSIRSAEACPFGMSSYSYYDETYTDYYTQPGSTSSIKNSSNVVLSSGTANATRSQFTHFTGGVKGEINLVFAKLDVYGEVTVGTERSVTVSATQYNIPPHSEAVFEAGSQTILTTGDIVTYDALCNMSKKRVEANYTYGEYIDFKGIKPLK